MYKCFLLLFILFQINCYGVVFESDLNNTKWIKYYDKDKTMSVTVEFQDTFVVFKSYSNNTLVNMNQDSFDQYGKLNGIHYLNKNGFLTVFQILKDILYMVTTTEDENGNSIMIHYDYKKFDEK